MTVGIRQNGMPPDNFSFSAVTSVLWDRQPIGMPVTVPAVSQVSLPPFLFKVAQPWHVVVARTLPLNRRSFTFYVARSLTLRMCVGCARTFIHFPANRQSLLASASPAAAVQV
jgi:hypothetical protein